MLTVAGVPAIAVAAAQSAVWSGQIADGATSGSLVIAGGFLSLANRTNSYSGGTVVAGGSALAIDADSQLGAISGGLALGDTTGSGKLALLNPGVFQSARAIMLGVGGGAINTEGSAPARLSRPITGPAA